jgi:TPR repeat protein
MKKTVYLMESFVTYVNKGSVDIDLDYFPQLQGLTGDQLAEELASGEYLVDTGLGEIRPKEPPEELKEMYTNEDGEIEYGTDDFVALWDYHREAEVDFDKIKDEKSYFYVRDEVPVQDDAEVARKDRSAAEQGDAQAQTRLGYAYQVGKGVAQDEAEAAKWYRLAADQGNAVAQSNLGVLYQFGLGVEKDEAEAAKWYRMAAEQGNAIAQSTLGTLYNTGCGVEKDEAEAARWYRMAADQGNAVAQSNLGVLYNAGRGVEKDETEAAKWYRKAADQGNEAAIKALKALEA